ncbi:hypothetical protein CIB95_01925 [Lottiidibacillus patelloidae]|uniref:DnaJ homologue subfamily C member 28 conserved domain-containing protein n=1 Tax=Lottiidibacillus patelloidae TaxID=2670334 RepID=A0A263BXQ7_9BACI|nr:DnaJ family domain-containing protein [Lottiidibacillus patelloidae]OZM58352.1 hypothetical protein CIB95_01925 [Lottiidibacillus patelloidae]
MANNYNDLIGEILKNTDGSDDYEGKGKPLNKEYLKRDVFQNFQQIAKDAGYLPPWLKLQKEITKLVQSADTELDVELINSKIIEHNKICPPPMQRMPISFHKLTRAREIWQP